MTPKVVQLHEYSLNFKDFFEIDRIFCSLGLSLRTWKLGHREIFSPHTIILSWNLDLPNLIFMSCCHIFLCAYHQHIFFSYRFVSLFYCSVLPFVYLIILHCSFLPMICVNSLLLKHVFGLC